MLRSSAVVAYMAKQRQEIIDGVVRDVAELPDRTSPDNWPDAMLVTADELRSILLARLTLARSAR
jgi:hypothetical protein